MSTRTVDMRGKRNRMGGLAAAAVAAGVLAWAGRADAAVAGLDAGTQIGPTQTTATSVSGTKTISAGTNRLLVVTVYVKKGTSDTTFGVTTATYGGQALTPVQATSATSRMKVYVGYLSEAKIAAASGNTINLTISAGTTTEWTAFAATYSGVNQTTPVTASLQSFNDTNTTTSATFGATNAVSAGGYTCYALATGAASATRTLPTGYAQDWALTTANTSTWGDDKPAAATGTENPTIAYSPGQRYALVALSLNPAASATTTTIADGTNPAVTTNVAPGSAAQAIDAFTVQSAGGTDTITAVQVSFAATTAQGVGLVEITDDAGATVYGSKTPAADVESITLSTVIPAATTSTQYRIRVTPKSHAAMPVPPGAAYGVTARITDVTVTNVKSVNDASSSTITIDNASSPNVTAASSAGGTGSVTASWTNPAAGTVPGTDFGSYVVVLGNTVAVTGAPAEGTASYIAGATVGADTVVCAGNITSCQKTGLGSSQAYYFEIFTRDGAGNWATGVATSGTSATAPTTTIADGAALTVTSPVAPGTAAQSVDAFTVQASSGTDTVTAVQVIFAPGSWSGVSLLEITNDAGTVVHGSKAPAADVESVTLGTVIPATATSTQYRLRITPKGHAAMPAPPGAVYHVTARVSDVTVTNVKSVNDATSSTLDIDNASSPDVSSASATPAATAVTASWTNPAAGVAPATDFAGYVVVLGDTVPVTSAPAEGTASYTAGGTLGADSVVCAGNIATCQKTALAAGQTYYMKIFTRDGASNWSPGVAVSATTTDGRTTPVSLTGSSSVCTSAALSASYTGDLPTSNNTVAFARGTSAAGPFTTLTACAAIGGGADPRACSDTTVAPSTTYYYRATFADADGVVGSASVDSGAVAVPACGAVVTPSVGTPVAPAANVIAGASGFEVGRIALVSTAPATVTSLAIQNLGTAVPDSDVGSLGLYTSAGTFVAASVWNGATSRYVFNRLSLGVSATSATYVVKLNLDPGATTTRTFQMSLTSPAGVGVTAPATAAAATLTGSIFTITASSLLEGSTSAAAPMVSIINPVKRAVVSVAPPANPAGVGFRVQIRVFNAGGIAAITANSVQVSTDNGATWPSVAVQKTSYDTGTPTVTATVYEALLNPAPGQYSLRARASNASVLNVVSAPVPITVRAAKTGDGNLLVRDNSSQLCSDCHALKSHSSESTSTTYGSWSTTCRDCHAPHGTRNVFLVNEKITPPSILAAQAVKSVGFSKTTGDSGAAGLSGTSPTAAASFVNSDNSGPCQVCHTRTGGATARWRNTGNADTHYTAATGTQACTGCHQHASGFAAGESSGGSNCSGCHGSIYASMNGATSGTHHHYMNNDTPTTNTMTAGTALGTTADTKRNCLMCHADHGVFRPDLNANGGRGKNLRTSVATVPTATANFTNTDFTSATSSLCVDCHSIEQTKSYADGTGTTRTVPVSGTSYAASAHDYGTDPTSTFRGAGTSTFVANCSKCHNDTMAKSFQTSAAPAQFSLHDSGATSLTAPLGGATTTGALEEQACYRCHSNAADPIGGTKKTADANDVYGAVTTMTAGATGIYAQMQKGTAGSVGGTATTTTSTLYFAPNAQEASPVTLTGHYGNDTLVSGTFATRYMTPFAQTTASELWDNVSVSTATTNPTRYRRVAFVSPPVATPVTLTAAAWTIAPFVQASSTTPSAHTCYAIWKYDGTCTYAGATPTCVAIVARATFGTGTTNRWGTTLAQQSIATAAGAATTLNAGDRIVVDLEVETQSTTAATATMNYVYGATAQAFVGLPNNVTFTYTSRPTSASGRHDVATYSGLHKPNPADELFDGVAANGPPKHVECQDCHAPHAAGKTKHTAGTNAIATTSPLYGVNGVAATFSTANWSAPTAYTTAATATAEYQICFKCHSGANTGLATWDSTWTNVALDFSTANKSAHPVVVSSNAQTGAGTPKALVAGQMVAPWTAVGTQTMQCSDCHGSDTPTAGSQGPHGSARKYILKGPNTRWPYQANGTTAWTIGNRGTSVGTADGLFCLNCHPNSNQNSAHSQSNHSNYACTTCHLRIPHGGKVSRLIATVNAPARYLGPTSNSYLQGFLKAAPTGYQQTGNCQAACYSSHSAVTGAEAW